MKLAFLIYSYFPYGGQQRDFLRIARECQARNHEVTVFTMKWQGETVPGIDVHLIETTARSRIRQYRQFTERVSENLRTSSYDQVVGFNKMPGLDVYFAADPCFAEKAETQRGYYYRYTPRYRHFQLQSEACRIER